MSPSGKALVSGTSIRGFESLHPSHEKRLRSFDLSLFSMYGRDPISRFCIAKHREVRRSAVKQNELAHFVNKRRSEALSLHPSQA